MPNPLDCLLVADDLTGACDAAVHFAPATVLIDPAHAAETRVLAVTTESRDLTPLGIRRALAATAHLSATRIFKKIDSTLRGNTGVEIAAALDAFQCDAAVICPAFPKQHRIVTQGHLCVSHTPEFLPIDVASRLHQQCGHPCVHVTACDIAARLAAGAHLVSVDAVCDEDLDRIADILFPMARRILWAGSAGLASALSRRLALAPAPVPKPARSGPVLFCIGSDHPVTCAQQDTLLAARPALLLHPRVATRETIFAALAGGTHVILRIPRGEIAAEQLRDRIAGAPAAALVLSGGDTASLVCRAAGVRCIELCDEIVAGVPRGILRGGEFDGLSVATKSGGFGPRDTLVQVADYFACPQPL